MNGLLADVNIAGEVRDLVETLDGSEEWSAFWDALNLPVLVFANIGLAPDSPDDVVWQTCQDNALILITGNRNNDGPTSLEATIRERLSPKSLPVITVSHPTSLGGAFRLHGSSRGQTARVALRHRLLPGRRPAVCAVACLERWRAGEEVPSDDRAAATVPVGGGQERAEPAAGEARGGDERAGGGREGGGRGQVRIEALIGISSARSPNQRRDRLF